MTAKSLLHATLQHFSMHHQVQQRVSIDKLLEELELSGRQQTTEQALAA